MMQLVALVMGQTLLMEIFNFKAAFVCARQAFITTICLRNVLRTVPRVIMKA